MARGSSSEAKLVASALKALRLRSGALGFFFKIHGSVFQMAGLPDVVGCYRGRFVAFEFKLPGKENTLTEIQQVILKKINKAGGKASMVTSVDQVMAVLDKIDAKKKQ